MGALKADLQADIKKANAIIDRLDKELADIPEGSERYKTLAEQRRVTAENRDLMNFQLAEMQNG